MTTFSSDQLNFFKFSTVVIDEFPVALRKVFEFLWNNQTAPPPGFQLWDDSPLVRNLFLNKESRPGRRKLNVPTSKSFMEWDCTALFEATLYAESFAMQDGRGGLATLDKLFVKPSGLRSPGTFHHSVISPSGNQAETFALALDQLRLLRNSLCHQTSTQKIDKATFDNYIQLSKDAIGALGQSTTKIDDVGKLGEKDFPTSRVQQLEEELRRERFKQIEDNQAQMDAKITNLGSDMKDLNTSLKGVISTANVLNSGVADVKKSLQVAESDANAVKSGITDIDTKLENVKSDVKDVKTEVISVTTKVVGVTLDVNFVKNEVTTLNPKVEEMRSDLRDMKPRVKTIETRTKDVGLDVKDIRTRVTDIKTKTEDIEALGKEIKIGMADVRVKYKMLVLTSKDSQLE